MLRAHFKQIGYEEHTPRCQLSHQQQTSQACFMTWLLRNKIRVIIWLWKLLSVIYRWWNAATTILWSSDDLWRLLWWSWWGMKYYSHDDVMIIWFLCQRPADALTVIDALLIGDEMLLLFYLGDDMITVAKISMYYTIPILLHVISIIAAIMVTIGGWNDDLMLTWILRHKMKVMVWLCKLLSGMIHR